jgi:hypothetical protein
MIKNKITTMLIFIATFLMLSCSSLPQEKIIENKEIVRTNDQIENEYLKKLEKIINSYEALIKSSGNKNSHYYKAYEHYLSILKNNQSTFSLDMNNENTIYSGASFNVNWETGNNKVSIGYRLIDIYNDFPSLVYSILTHEIWHAYDYHINNESFKSSKSDPFEQVLYEMDAIYVEAQFISDVVIDNYKTSKFEDYLYSTFINNQLDMFSIVNTKIDIAVIHKLYNAKHDFYIDKNMSKLDEVLGAESVRLVDNYHNRNENDLFNEYISLVSIDTYQKFSTILFKQIEGSINPNQTWDEIISKYPKYGSTIFIIQDILENNMQKIEDMNSKYKEMFMSELK